MKNYFPHDHHARSDKKIINLMRVFGLAGVGLYWCIIEMLYEENGWLQISDLESIAYDLRADTKTLNSLISNFDLFFIDGEKFSSRAVLSRLKLIESKSSQASKAARLRWQKCKEDANAMQTHSDRNAIKEIKTNEIKENESKTDKKKASDEANTLFGKVEYLDVEEKYNQSGNQLQNFTPDSSICGQAHPPEKIEKPKEKSSAKKEKVLPHFFEDSPYYHRESFVAYFTPSHYPLDKYPDADIEFYYEKVKHWAEYGSGKKPGKQRAKDWAATARTFMQRDADESKLRTKQTSIAKTNGEPNYYHRQQHTNGVGADLETAVAMSRLLVSDGYKQAG